MPDPTPPLDLEQLDRYLAGELSPDDAAAMARTLGASGHGEEVVVAIRQALSPEPSPDRDRVRRLVQERIDASRGIAHGTAEGIARGAQHPRGHGTRSQPSRRWPSVPRAVWYAAVCATIGVAGISAGWYGRIARVESRSATAPVVYATTNGQRANITLPDSTTVTLNVASRLEVPADYAAGNRALRLSGEALFNVRHGAGNPFTVTAGSTTARVLGTSFTMRKYTTDSTATVAVRDGKVAVRSVVLTASRQATVGESGAVRLATIRPADFSFATGVLTLDGVPFPQAITELNRWYDADIRLGDPSLATRRIAGECAAGSLADLVTILEMMFDVRVVRDGRTLTLYAK